MNEEKLFHIGITRSQGAKYAVLPGDPARVEKIARYLDNAKFLAQNREFTSYAGELCGERVIIMSTGIGGASAAIALEELAMAGLKTADDNQNKPHLQNQTFPLFPHRMNFL